MTRYETMESVELSIELVRRWGVLTSQELPESDPASFLDSVWWFVNQVGVFSSIQTVDDDIYEKNPLWEYFWDDMSYRSGQYSIPYWMFFVASPDKLARYITISILKAMDLYEKEPKRVQENPPSAQSQVSETPGEAPPF
jgi:hypothetical protein